MMQYTYYSNFAQRINAFIDYKRALGYAYGDSSRILREFDLLCNKKFPEKAGLDQELGLAWLERKSTEAEGSHRNRIMVIREFAKYLCSVGEPAYLIPITMTRKPKRYTPHIFTDNELTEFFRAADSFALHDKAPARHLVVPVFFRTVYCCGLRPSEARLLLTENVDLDRGILGIIESKGHKDRLVPMSEDLRILLCRYDRKISEIYPERKNFFPRYDGNGAYTKLWTEEMFWRCFDMAGITDFEGVRPRVYDFRHTFATNCILRWAREGKNIDAMLPFLSSYMGHVQPDDTAYYIHIIPELYKHTTKLDIASFEALLPEVPYED